MSCDIKTCDQIMPYFSLWLLDDEKISVGVLYDKWSSISFIYKIILDWY